MTRSRKRSLFIEFVRPPPPGKPKPKPGGGPVTTMMVGEEKGKPDYFSSSSTGENFAASHEAST